MIEFLVGVTEFFVCLCCIVIFASLFLISLAFLDYVYDTDLKNKLCTLIHKPAFLSTLRKHVTEKIEDFDGDARKEDERLESVQFGRYKYFYRNPPTNSQTETPRSAIDYKELAKDYYSRLNSTEAETEKEED